MVKEDRRQFADISFKHIFRENNSHAGKLSKEALSLQEGLLIEQEFKDNLQVSEAVKSIL